MWGHRLARLGRSAPTPGPSTCATSCLLNTNTRENGREGQHVPTSGGVSCRTGSLRRRSPVSARHREDNTLAQRQGGSPGHRTESGRLRDRRPRLGAAAERGTAHPAHRGHATPATRQEMRGLEVRAKAEKAALGPNRNSCSSLAKPSACGNTVSLSPRWRQSGDAFQGFRLSPLTTRLPHTPGASPRPAPSSCPCGRRRGPRREEGGHYRPGRPCCRRTARRSRPCRT